MNNVLGNKIVWIVGAVIVLGLIVFFAMQGTAPAPTEGNKESAEDVSTGSVNSGTAGTLSYQQALTKYADRRIQFDTTCQANPNNMTYKDNTGIMLDNRSPNVRTIKIVDTYTVKAWSFKIITLPDTYRASKTILVDCGTSQNVATILVQE